MREQSFKNANNSRPNDIRGGETKVMKKLLSSLLVLALLLTMVVPAFANTSEEDLGVYADAVSRLGSLEVLKGYTDGTFRPDNTITRAEFAAVAVRLLGLEDAAKVSQGKTQFTDYIDTWATGYVNVAAQQGIIKGYTDGTFRPANNVTQAEALAMIIRVLGYEPIVDSSNWPTSYIVKAVELGLTDNVDNVSANTAATRGVVALFADNALTKPMLEQTVFGANPEYAPNLALTILSKNLKATKVAGLITDVFALGNSALDANQVTVTTSTGTEVNVTLSADQDALALLHKKVSVWYTGVAKNVVHLTTADAGTKVTGAIAGYDDTTEGVYASYSATFNIGTGTTVYKVNADTKTVVDFGTGAGLVNGQQAELYVNSKNEVVAIQAVGYDDASFELFKQIKDDVLKVKAGTTTTDLIDQLSERNITFVKNGELATAADLAENDVLYVFGDNQVVVAFDAKVSGDFTRLSGDALTIGGTKVTAVDEEDTLVSTNGGTSFALDAVLSQLAKNVTVLKGGNNKVVALYTTDATDAETYNYALYLGSTTNFSGTKVETYYNVLTKDGSAWLKVNADAVLASAVVRGDIIDLSVNAAGEITKTVELSADLSAQTITPDTKRSTLALVGAEVKVVGDSIVFVHNSSLDSYSVKTWVDVKDQTDFTAADVFYQKDTTLTVGALKVASTEVAVENTGKAGIVVAKYVAKENTSTVYKVEINENGTVNTYKLADETAYTNAAAQQFVTYNVTNGVATLVADTFDTEDVVITEVGNGYFQYEVAGSTVTEFYHEDVEVYDVRLAKTDAVTTATLAKGQTVSFVNHKTDIDFVQYIVIK